MFPFIALEGCDGAGKTTTRKLVTRDLARLGLPVFAVGQHSWLDLESSRVIAKLRSGVGGIPPDRVSRAYLLDKRAHHENNIAPARPQAFVICDRWILSDAVYQEVLYGMRAEQIIAAYDQAGVPWPQMIIYVDCEVPSAYNRILARGKATRHYERPPELSEICAVYDRILGSRAIPEGTGVVRVPNHGSPDDLSAMVEGDVIPRITSLLGMHRR